jgi:hypothetical protein
MSLTTQRALVIATHGNNNNKNNSNNTKTTIVNNTINNILKVLLAQGVEQHGALWAAMPRGVLWAATSPTRKTRVTMMTMLTTVMTALQPEAAICCGATRADTRGKRALTSLHPQLLHPCLKLDQQAQHANELVPIRFVVHALIFCFTINMEQINST